MTEGKGWAYASNKTRPVTLWTSIEYQESSMSPREFRVVVWLGNRGICCSAWSDRLDKMEEVENEELDRGEMIVGNAIADVADLIRKYGGEIGD